MTTREGLYCYPPTPGGVILLALIVLLTACLVSFLAAIFLGVRYHFRLPKKRNISVAGVLLLVVGSALVVHGSKKIEEARAKKSWPSAQAVIVSSKVGGKRAFHPEVVYRYRVGEKKFVGQTIMNMPGFGGRTNRLDAAEKIVAAHKAGTMITVHYNPQQSQMSVISIVPTYTVFMQLSVGVMMVCLAVFWFSLRADE
jgi:high-affinity Fe2+/Pb2+ permease